MSTASNANNELGECGKSLLPPDLSRDDLAAAPILASLDALLIDGLTESEDTASEVALSR